MPIKEREILFKINEQVVKLQQSPPSTFAPSTGEDQEEKKVSTPAFPVYRPPTLQQ